MTTHICGGQEHENMFGGDSNEIVILNDSDEGHATKEYISYNNVTEDTN